MSISEGASTKLGLGGILAEVCHCCSQKALILQFALIKMASGHLELSLKPIAGPKRARRQQGVHDLTQWAWEGESGWQSASFWVL